MMYFGTVCVFNIVQLIVEYVGFPLEPSTCREDQVRQASGGWWLQVAQGRL